MLLLTDLKILAVTMLIKNSTYTSHPCRFELFILRRGSCARFFVNLADFHELKLK
ncbi:unnamed protein product, partial [Heterotrigona itama]